ncbi:hypothetical protein AZE42_13055 [Rhizopogon vesiculosus]|uniref:Uncharacterized protein n=1 Tax=Rhizopogon vesiculosus TaxID=180088 RepID=A0A1J8QWT3_9AGAM|nr:hypothetical protein AZE42_13055 [Rhizopogon vesiculosus]
MKSRRRVERLVVCPIIRSLATETKVLYRDVFKFSSSPRVADLSALNTKRAEGDRKGGKKWMLRKDTHAQQVLEWKMEFDYCAGACQGPIGLSSHKVFILALHSYLVS